MDSQGPCCNLDRSQQDRMKLFLEQTIALLRESQSTNDAVQRDVQRKLDEWGRLPEFNYSLMCILADMNLCDETTRSLSCLILKNNVRKYYGSFPDELKEVIKSRALELLSDSSSVIRATVGILVLSVAASDALISWNQLFPTLCRLISSDQNEIVESTFLTIHRICEDLTEILCADSFHGTLNEMLPQFIGFFRHPNPRTRNYALMSVNQFVSVLANAMLSYMDAYVEGLFSLFNDQDSEVKKNVCRSLITLVEKRPETIVPHVNLVIQYFLARSKDGDDEVVLEACEFWLSIPECEFGRLALRQFLPELIPFFMDKMRYSPEAIETMRADFEDNYMVPDKDEDIRPRFYRSKIQPQAQGDAAEPAAQQQDGSDISDLGDDGWSDEEDEDGSSDWNIRKCTAASLDCLAHNYGDEILPIVIQELQKSLHNDDWIVREAAILAVGAIAEGALTGMMPHLTSLVPYLVEQMSHAHPMVRSITCWTVTRYTFWIVQEPVERFFEAVLLGLLKCIMDDNKRVQEASCSAFATLAECAGVHLVPYIEHILNTLVKAFERYQHKNLLNLFDAVGTLAEAVRNNLNNPKYIEILMPPIIKRWNSLTDTDRDLFPLLECLSNIAVALREGFKPYSEVVFQRCLSIVEFNLRQAMAHEADPTNNEMPDKDFIVAAVDLLSGVAEGLGDCVGEFVMNTNLMELTLRCMVDPMAEVRQSSFALLGDLSKSCFQLVQPHIQQVMPPLIENLRCEDISVCNNATWAVGEIALKMSGSIQQYVPLIFSHLLTNINQPEIPRTLHDNIAICIGRVAYACPENVAPMLKDFIKPWCSSVRSIRDNDAKDSAFRGICELIKKNPSGVINDFYYFCDALACWDEPKQDLKQLFYEILVGFKTQVGEQSWQQFTQSFPVDVREKLASQYGV